MRDDEDEALEPKDRLIAYDLDSSGEHSGNAHVQCCVFVFVHMKNVHILLKLKLME